MKKIVFALSLIALALSAGIFFSMSQVKKRNTPLPYHDGDVIFQASNSRQCEAVKLATHSDISHCGILFQQNNSWFVLEAVEPVSIIRLDQFIARGIGGHYQIKRLKPEFNSLDSIKTNAMFSLGHSWIARHYDIFFNWGYGELYCSELVWKLYHDAAGIDLCSLKTLRDYDLNAPLVKQMMAERYGREIPYQENMIAPSDISSSEKMMLVEER